jgi:hypothetical protein
MKSEEPFTRPGTRSHRGRGGNGLFYFEDDRSRLSLRFTRLAVVLVVLFTVIPVSALFILFLSRTDPADTKVDVNVRTLPPVGVSTSPRIQQPPPPKLKIQRPEPLPSFPSPPGTVPTDPTGMTKRGASAAPTPHAMRKN